MRSRKNKNLLIGILCCLLVFMGIGYAALSQVLNITSTANITGNFNIIIDDISKNADRSSSSAIDAGTEAPKNTTARYSAVFSKPGDYITYDVAVKNMGSIKGVLESIKVTQKAKEGTGMQESLSSKGLNVDQVFRTEVFEAGGEKKVEYGKVLSPEEFYYFEIKTTFAGNMEFIPEGSIETQITVKYEQEGNSDYLDTQSSGSSELLDDFDIEVNSEGLLTRINIDKHTENGWLVLPATASDGRPIKSIDENSFLRYNAAEFYDYDEEKNEETGGYIIYDEEHFDEIREIIESNTGYYGSGYYDYGSGYYSSNNLLGDVKPSKLTTDKSDKPTVKALSGYGSSHGTHDMQFYKVGGITLSENAEIEVIYADLKTKRLGETSSLVKRLDLTKAINLTTIKEKTFNRSRSLSEIKFSDSITTIGYRAFREVEFNGKLVLPNSLKTIEQEAFDGSRIGDEVYLPNSLEYIGEYAFRNSDISGELTIPGSVTTIGGAAFDYNQINKLTLENGVTTIESAAFTNNQIRELALPDSVITIGPVAFSNNQINKLTLGTGVTTIASSAFISNQISELALPDSVTTIGDYAFSENQISKLTIPSSVTTMGYSAFTNNQISELTIPSSVTTIGEYAFASNNMNKLTILPGVTTIGNSAFSENQISKLTIPSSVTTIGDSAFISNQISELIITEGVTTIAPRAFTNNQISELTIPSSVTTIGEYAFASNNMNKLTILPGVTTIGNSAFRYNKISELIIPEGVITIEDDAFNENRIGELTIPGSVTTIGGGAFSDNPLSLINIQRTEQDFNANVVRAYYWYPSYPPPTIIYQAE